LSPGHGVNNPHLHTFAIEKKTQKEKNVQPEIQY
jgi:hypothetical protein